MDNTSKKIKVLLIFLIVYLIMLYIITPLLVNYMFSNNSIIKELFAEILSLCLPIIAILIFSRDKVNYKMLFNIYNKPLKSINYKQIFLWIVVIVFISIMLNYIFYLIDTIQILINHDYSIINTLPNLDFLTFIFSIIVIVIIPAIFEEISYRGMYYDTYKDTNEIIMIAISTIVFASLHNSLYNFIYALLLGIILMLCYRQTHSINMVIILHLVSNLLSFIFNNVITLPFSPLNNLLDYVNDNQFKSIIMAYIGIIALMIIILIMAIKKLKINSINYKIAKKLNSLDITISVIICLIAIASFIYKLC